MTEKTRRREAAIEALLTLPSVEAAAKQSHVSSRTIRRWMHDEAFVMQYQQARRQLFDAALGRLTALTEQAVARLEKILHDETVPTSLALAACRIVLERAFAAREFDLQAQIAQLEQMIGEITNENHHATF